jgi:hypothetical protein
VSEASVQAARLWGPDMTKLIKIEGGYEYGAYQIYRVKGMQSGTWGAWIMKSGPKRIGAYSTRAEALEEANRRIALMAKS